MDNRLETLFSPERLEKRWAGPIDQKDQPATQWHVRMETASVPDALSSLSGEILTAVKAGHRQQVLSAMLAKIRVAAQAVFRPDRDPPVQDDEVFALVNEIQQLEDMVEAYLSAQGDL
ncbi:hypothetical protein [Desulfobacter vibrioformis]|uniref:hypothetical protein n=1 Tax=Desulfobacter vibrioformis TaxID=34031 RepID=UPI0005570105|nr:hypothetical protein [Desulfobacter vibrioformis]